MSLSQTYFSKADDFNLKSTKDTIVLSAAVSSMPFLLKLNKPSSINWEIISILSFSNLGSFVTALNIKPPFSLKITPMSSCFIFFYYFLNNFFATHAKHFT